eukprot:8212532-Karenia_brevis.AAC.1
MPPSCLKESKHSMDLCPRNFMMPSVLPLPKSMTRPNRLYSSISADVMIRTADSNALGDLATTEIAVSSTNVASTTS